MPKDVTQIAITGTLGRDPEQKTLDSGLVITSFPLAVNEDDKGTAAVWYDVSLFGKAGDNILKLVGKGDKAFVGGSLKHRSYKDKNDQWKTVPQIAAKEVIKLGLMSVSSEPAQQETRTPQQKFGAPANAPSSDDEIPF